MNYEKTINVVVNDQELTADYLDSVISTVNLVKCHFSFNEWWDGFPVRIAHFENAYSGVKISRIILNNFCIVPWEVLVDKGKIKIALEGLSSDGQVERTESLAIIKQRITITNGDNLIDPTPDQYAQFITDIMEWCKEQGFTTTEELQQLLPIEVRDYFDAHQDEFQGPSGDDGISPIAYVEKIGSVSKLTVIDKTGETSVEINDGKDGDGYTLTDTDKVEIANEIKELVPSYDDTELRGEIASFEERLKKLEYVPIEITSASASPSSIEQGTSASVRVTWVINKSPDSLRIKANPDGSWVELDVADREYTQTVSSGTGWTIEAKDEKNTVTRNANISFSKKIFYGVKTSHTFESSWLDTLTSAFATSNTLSSKKINAESGQYIYFASSFNNPVFVLGGFVTDFNEIGSIIRNGTIYKVYRSTQSGLGSTTLEVR